MDDKTQLLPLVLAARFRSPLPIVLGILVATLANHALAASYSLFAWVAAGTMLGVMIASVPVEPLGNHVLRRVPVRLMRLIAASTFIVLGAAVLMNIRAW